MVASRHLVLYGIRKLCITLDAPTATQTHMRVHSCYVGEIPYAPSRQIVDRIIASIKFNINDILYCSFVDYRNTRFYFESAVSIPTQGVVKLLSVLRMGLFSGVSGKTN